MAANPFTDRPGSLRAKLVILYGVLGAANLGAWAIAVTAFRAQPALLATAFLAYSFGLRHAFDADHIAAIDNVVRKLRQDGKAPYSAGFFFSLGHSTIVFAACLAIALAASLMRGPLAVARDAGGIAGTAVSAGFLLLVGTANLLILSRLWGNWRAAARGEPITDEAMETLLDGRGLLARMLRPLFRLVARSWHLYPIGVLFGLGFDTATEVGMLGISATQAAHALPIWIILIFPALFAAGMTLMDTTDSVLMTGAYGWAFLTPARKLGYNLIVTALSVTIALVIGGAEALGLIAQQLRLDGTMWRGISDFSAGAANYGLVIAGLFAATWLLSMLLLPSREGR